MNYNEIPTAELGRARKVGKGTSGATYYLHRLPARYGEPAGTYNGYGMFIRYKDPVTKVSMSYLVREDLPASAVEDFDYYVDVEDEETRILRANAAAEFGF